MQVEIAIKVDGRTVKTHVAHVTGNLEEMEEITHALGKRVACDTLQATVDARPEQRPLFRKTAARGGTKGIRAAP